MLILRLLDPMNSRTSNKTGDYTIYFEILKTCKQIKVISRATLLSDMQPYISALKKIRNAEFKPKTEDEIIGSALNRLSQGGWNIVGVMGDSFVLEGFMPIGKRARIKEAKKK